MSSDEQWKSKELSQWVGTLNNYTYDEIIKLFSKFVNTTWDTATASPKWVILDQKDIKYCIFNFEIGESGTPHIQLYINFPRSKRFAATKKWLGSNRWHIEPVRGTLDHNIIYCSKTEDPYKDDLDKAERGEKFKCTLLPDPPGFYVLRPSTNKNEIWKSWPIHSGTSAPENPACFEYGDPNKCGQGRRNDLEACKTILDSKRGKDALLEIGETHFSDYVRYSKGFEKYQQLKFNSHRRTEPPKVYVLMGKAGAGKSSYVRNKHGIENIFIPIQTENGKWWWDEYCGEDVVLIEDIKKANLRDTLLLTDRYDYRGEVKGSTTWVNPKFIYFTCQDEPATWFSNMRSSLLEFETEPGSGKFSPHPKDEQFNNGLQAFYRRVNEFGAFIKFPDPAVLTSLEINWQSPDALEGSTSTVPIVNSNITEKQQAIESPHEKCARAEVCPGNTIPGPSSEIPTNSTKKNKSYNIQQVLSIAKQTLKEKPN